MTSYSLTLFQHFIMIRITPSKASLDIWIDTSIITAPLFFFVMHTLQEEEEQWQRGRQKGWWHHQYLLAEAYNFLKVSKYCIFCICSRHLFCNCSLTSLFVRILKHSKTKDAKKLSLALYWIIEPSGIPVHNFDTTLRSKIMTFIKNDDPRIHLQCCSKPSSATPFSLKYMFDFLMNWLMLVASSFILVTQAKDKGLNTRVRTANTHINLW